MGKIKKMSLLIKILVALLAVIVILLSALIFVFRNELKTINGIKKIHNSPMYEMTYHGDYSFDEFLEVGATTDTDVVDFVTSKLLKGLPITIELPDLACSTTYSKTPEGDYVFGRNFDLDFSPSMIVHTEPDNGYKSVSISNLAFMGYNENYLPESFADSIVALAAPYVPIDGMNSKGLSVGVLLLADFEMTNQKSGKIGLQTTTAIRMLLDKCANVDEALAMLEQYDMNSSAGSTYHFQIADATGKSVIVEYINNEMIVLEPEEFYQACTNFVLTPGEHYEFGRGQDRYKVLMEKLDETNGILSEDDVMTLLEEVALPYSEEDKARDSEIQWSAVYNLNDLTASVAVGGDYDNIIDFGIDEK